MPEYTVRLNGVEIPVRSADITITAKGEIASGMGPDQETVANGQKIAIELHNADATRNNELRELTKEWREFDADIEGSPWLNKAADDLEELIGDCDD